MCPWYGLAISFITDFFVCRSELSLGLALNSLHFHQWGSPYITGLLALLDLVLVRASPGGTGGVHRGVIIIFFDLCLAQCLIEGWCLAAQEVFLFSKACDDSTRATLQRHQRWVWAEQTNEEAEPKNSGVVAPHCRMSMVNQEACSSTHGSHHQRSQHRHQINQKSGQDGIKARAIPKCKPRACNVIVKEIKNTHCQKHSQPGSASARCHEWNI